MIDDSFFLHTSYDKLKPYMAKIKANKFSNKRVVSYAMFAVAIIAPLANSPQIYKLFSLKVTEGLSVETWIMYIVFGVVQLVYAVANRIKPLIVSNILWFAVDIVMVYGIISLSVAKAPPDYSYLLMINNIGKAIMGLALICLSSAAAIFSWDLYNNEKITLKRIAR